MTLQYFKAASILGDLVRMQLARGTHPHYAVTTIVRTTAVPATVIKVTDIILDCPAATTFWSPSTSSSPPSRS
ncbi:hypothetical protein [Arthrobacter bambusae]|uniref:Uncharacterized protein n=1 Tax=Arthrobacter bambusae TaxID=1338426 RepID=A0AAW8DHZ3_9MICC|nr:hypothetical protein [Arthrobacter bambusae]MDP9905652.1 hypothetical protein [Arthrobacter bambusae]MDQ0127266.1 hypothetical protein [Arthrobacter bambusae]MDQ0178608.1 hypothetical protein [Arthrobacter bambusae]